MSNMFNAGTGKRVSQMLSSVGTVAQRKVVHIPSVTVAESSHSSFTYPTFSSEAVRLFNCPAKAFENQLKRQQIWSDGSCLEYKVTRVVALESRRSRYVGSDADICSRHREQQQLPACPYKKHSTLPLMHFSGIATGKLNANETAKD